jgi:hypothetical protein
MNEQAAKEQPTASRAQMKVFTILGEILTVLGPIGVLGLWLFQQTAVEQRSSELRKLSAARGVFQTYQSNNALFNAINEIGSPSEQAAHQVRTFQVYNYELGLAAIEAVLTPAERSGIPPTVNAYSGTPDIRANMAQMQQRLELLQRRLSEKEAAIGRSAAAAQRTAFWTYIVLSLLAILGGASKVVDKLRSR